MTDAFDLKLTEQVTKVAAKMIKGDPEKLGTLAHAAETVRWFNTADKQATADIAGKVVSELVSEHSAEIAASLCEAADTRGEKWGEMAVAIEVTQLATDTIALMAERIDAMLQEKALEAERNLSRFALNRLEETLDAQKSTIIGEVS